MVDTKGGGFIGSLDILRLPLDGLVAWRIFSTHRDKDCDVTEHGQLAKDLPNPLISARCISRRLKVVEQDKAPLLWCLEFRNDLFQRDLLISSYLQLYVQDFKKESC